jgi:Amidohydrolase family
MLRYPAAACLAVAVAGSVPPPAEPTLAITGVVVVDVLQGTRQPDQTVLITGDRIVSIGPARSTRVPADAEVVHGSRKFLIPGLWDMHSHVVGFGPTSLELYLAHGVTSVRDMGAERFADAKAWRDRIAAGQLLGPRMRIASPVVENAEWLAAVKRMGERAGVPWTLYERFGPTSVAEAVSWVDSMAVLGPDHIKVRNWPPPEIGRALVERARQRGLPVVAHGNEPFPRTGVATLEHQIWPPLTISGAERKSLWRQFAANGVALVPTLVTWPIRLDPPDAILARIDSGRIPGGQYVSATTHERWRNQLLQLKQERPMDWTSIHRDEMRNVAEMRKAGMTLLAGTDIGAPLLVPGISLHDELALLVNVAGMTPLQALQSATVAAARVVGVADSLGSIGVGKLADLVVLEADPLLDIRNAKQIHAVVANGRLLDRATLNRMLAEAQGTAGDAAGRLAIVCY